MRLLTYQLSYCFSLLCLFSCAINDQNLKEKKSFINAEETIIKKNIKQLEFIIIDVSSPGNSPNIGSKIETIVTVEAMMNCTAKLMDEIKYEFSENKKTQKLNLYVSAFAETKFSLRKNEETCVGDIAVTRALKITTNRVYSKDNVTLINQKKLKNPINSSPGEPNPDIPGNEQRQLYVGSINDISFNERNKNLILKMSYDKGCTQQRFEIYYRSNCIKLSGTDGSICYADLIHYKTADVDCNTQFSNQTNEFNLESKLSDIGPHTLSVSFKSNLGIGRSFHFTVK
jgi:hypothetical protein